MRRARTRAVPGRSRRSGRPDLPARALTPALTLTLALLAAAAAPRALAHSSEGPPVPLPLVRGTPDPATRLRATVVGADGTPVAGARVVIDTALDVLRARTGADGRMDFALPTASPVARVIIVAPGHGLVVTGWTETPPQAVSDLGVVRLPPVAEIRGRVADADGRPVRWARVQIDGWGAVGAAAWATVARLTDAARVDCDDVTGEFRIDTLPAGDLTLTAGSVTHDIAPADVRAPAHNLTLRGAPWPDGPHFDFALKLGPPDDIWPDERVVAETPTTLVDLVRVPANWDEGIFRVPLLPPVTLRFLPSAWHEPATVRLDRVPRDPVEILARPRRNTALGGTASVRGVVTLDCAPATWSDAPDGASGHRYIVEVRCEPRRRPKDDDGRGPAYLVADTVTAPDGSFALDGLSAGRISARVTGIDASFGDPRDAPVPGRTAALEKDGTLRVPVLRRESRQLRISVAADVRAARDFAVECTAAPVSRRGRPGVANGLLPCTVEDIAPTADAPTGAPRTLAVTIRSVPPDAAADVAIRVRSRGVWTRRVLARSVPAEAAPVITIGRDAILRGGVFADGVPVAGAVVTVSHPAGGTGGDIVVTNLDGHFELAGMDPSVEWRIAATADDLGGWTSAFAGPREVRIEARRPARRSY